MFHCLWLLLIYLDLFKYFYYVLCMHEGFFVAICVCVFINILYFVSLKEKVVKVTLFAQECGGVSTGFRGVQLASNWTTAKTYQIIFPPDSGKVLHDNSPDSPGLNETDSYKVDWNKKLFSWQVLKKSSVLKFLEISKSSDNFWKKIID